MGLIIPSSQGSRLKTTGSKAESSQGGKEQVGKDVTSLETAENVPGQVMFPCLFWNFRGFLSGSRA